MRGFAALFTFHKEWRGLRHDWKSCPDTERGATARNLLLLADVAELVETASAKEPVMHHTHAEQIDGHDKGDQEQNLNSMDPRF